MFFLTALLGRSKRRVRQCIPALLCDGDEYLQVGVVARRIQRADAAPLDGLNDPGEWDFGEVRLDGFPGPHADNVLRADEIPLHEGVLQEV